MTFTQTAIISVTVILAPQPTEDQALFQSHHVFSGLRRHIFHPPAEDVEPSPSCWAAYLCAADNCQLDNVKLAHKGEWALLKTVMMADFVQFVMRGCVQ